MAQFVKPIQKELSLIIDLTEAELDASIIIMKHVQRIQKIIPIFTEDDKTFQEFTIETHESKPIDCVNNFTVKIINISNGSEKLTGKIQLTTDIVNIWGTKQFQDELSFEKVSGDELISIVYSYLTEQFQD